MITVFKDFSDTKNPKYYEIDKVLEAIKDCKIQKQIDEIRAEKDEKIQNRLKKMLPCILFSGVFSVRLDSAIQKHSGFVVLDFDDIEDLEAKKKEVISYPFVYSCFVSPRGNGLKAVVRVPESIEKHRGHYMALNALFNDLDSTSINESRICYMSADSSLYLNKNAICFEGYIEPKQEAKNQEVKKSSKVSNSNKIDIALAMVKNAVDGEKHIELLKASRLMGGYISAKLISEDLATELLESEIKEKGVDDFHAAQVTIRKGIEHGKNAPIDLTFKSDFTSKIKSVIDVDDDDFSFIAEEEEIDEYLDKWIKGTFERGLTTGIPSLDKHFLFKRGNFNVVNGFDNVGKSTALWYLALLSAMYNKWSWIIYSNENRSGTVVKRLIEFYWGKTINKLTESQVKKGKEFISNHFTFISNQYLFNYKDVLNIAEKLQKVRKYDAILIDPYNSLKIDLSNNSKLSTHEYHYEAASEMQVFTKKNDICIYLNCHVITGAMRLQKGETRHRAPGKADTEGGGKFSNKADDFMTFHREVQDMEKYTKMEIHVRKIKEIETGGSYTPYDDPYILEMQKGMCSYADLNGYDPVREYWLKQGVQMDIEIKEEPHRLVPNKSFFSSPNEEPPF
jgi:hypothetical protein